MLMLFYMRFTLYFSLSLLKGIQAQTVANFYLAFEAQLTIIPVINKVSAKHLKNTHALFIISAHLSLCD